MKTHPLDPLNAAIGLQRWLCLFWLWFVIYGSLVPLDYRWRPFDEAVSVLLALADRPLNFGSRSDWATNLLLFIPLTFFAGQGFASRVGAAARIAIGALLAVAAAALAVGIEFAQIYFPTRTASQNDIVALCISGVLGVLLHWAIGARVTVWIAGYWHSQMLGDKVSRLLKGYLFVLFAFGVMPLDLTISPVEIYHKWREGRVFLIPFSGLKGGLADMVYQVLTDVLIWVPAGVLWAMRPGQNVLRVALKGLLAALLIEGLQLFVLSRTTDLTTALLGGFGCGLGAWARLRVGQHGQAWTQVPAATWMTAWAVWALAVLGVFWFPFGFDPGLWSGAAAWEALTRTPLSTYYGNSEIHAVNELLRKVGFFVPGGLLLGLAGSAGRAPPAHRSWWPYLLLALVPFIVEAGQLLLPDKVADLSDFAFEWFGGVLGYRMARWVRQSAPQWATTAAQPGKTVGVRPASAMASSGVAPTVERFASAVSRPASPSPSPSPSPPRLPRDVGTPTQAPSWGEPAASDRWGGAYIALVLVAAVHSWMLAGAAGMNGTLSVLAIVAVIAMLCAPRFPWAGLGIYAAAAYGVPRYSPDYQALLASGILNWLVVLAAAGWFVCLLRGRIRLRLDGWLMFNMALLAIWGGVCALAAWARASGANAYPMLHPEQFVHAWIVMVVARHVFGRGMADWGFGLMLCAALVVRALVQGKSGIYLENDIAALCVMVLPIALFGAWSLRTVWLRGAFAVLGAGLVGIVAMAQNRGAAVGLALALAVVWWNTRKRLLWALCAIPLLALAAVLVPSSYIQRFAVIFDPAAEYATSSLDRATIDDRKDLWRAAARVFNDHRWLGVGPGNSEAVLKMYRPGSSRIRIHNSFIDAATETGALGFLLFTSLFVGAIVLLQRRMRTAETEAARTTMRMVQASLAGYVGISLFLSRFDMQLAYLLVGWAGALVGVRHHQSKRSRRSHADAGPLRTRSMTQPRSA